MAIVVRRLVRAIDYAEGFWLGFVRCNLIGQRRKAAAACRDLLAPLGIRLVEIDLTEPISELLPILKAHIAKAQGATNAASEGPPTSLAAAEAARPAKLALFVYGLEHSIPSSEAYPPILSHLNLNRELFRQEILYPLVIWLPEYALAALARRAPDFWAWRSGLYEFAPDAELAAHTLAPVRNEAFYVSASLSEQAKRERLAMLKGLLADYRELGDGPHERRTQTEILNQLGWVHRALGELSEARQAYQDSLAIARDDNDLGMIAVLVHNLAMLALDQGNYEEARRLYDQSLEIKKRLGNQSGIAITLHELGRLAQRQGDYEEARRLYGESLEIAKRLGDQSGIAITQHQLAMLAEDQGEYEEARRLYSESLEIEKRLGNQNGIAISLHQLGSLAQDEGDYEEARRLYDESLTMKRKLGNIEGEAISFHALALLDEDEGKYAEALEYAKQAQAIFERLKSPYTESINEMLRRLQQKLSAGS
ncbi:MAG TPA: tetratricopeptide repeat protein [Blastocatellia bacterium]|nr:tetratricopeptide repeat protein [Blastocatellia bacterium]